MSCHNSENWPQRNGNKRTLELKINCTYNNQDETDQTTKDQFEMTVRDDCAVSACSSPHQTPVYKCSHPLLFGGWGKSAFGQMSATPGPLPFSCCLKQSKFSFPPSWPAYWLLSGEQSDTLCVPFGNNERWHMYLFSARGSNWHFPLESCRPHYIQSLHRQSLLPL